jgi:uncharacterized iron-regulated membrane protein
MRSLFVRLHRWLGIATALFLFVAGSTGAVIAWDHELDAAINPAFFHARTQGAPLAPLDIARRVEADDPRLEVTYLPLSVEPGHTLQLFVTGRTDPTTGKPYELGYNQVAVDPVTGEIQARREWGAVSLAPLNLIPFLYKLHYTLHLPNAGAFEIGTWVMGIVGIAWMVDSVIALVLAFPSRKAWRKSFAFRVRRGGYALTFDLHRSGGVWVWGLLLLVAVTSVSMNLSAPVVQPIVSLFSPLSPTPFSHPERFASPKPDAIALPRERIVALATEAGRREHVGQPPGAVFYSPLMKMYGVGYFGAGKDHGDGGLGNPWTYWNGVTGEPAGQSLPGRGSAGDIFMQAQFPLHSGRIIGLTGRIMMSAMGVIVAMLSITGLVIWLKKLRARQGRAQKSAQVPARTRDASFDAGAARASGTAQAVRHEDGAPLQR